MSALQIAILVLSADSGIIAAVGPRVYPIVAPQGVALPYIVAALIGEEDEQLLSGAGKFFDSRVEIATFAASAAAADKLGELVKEALQDVTARSIDDGNSPAEFAAITTIMKLSSDVTDFSDDRTVYRRIQDYAVRWRRT